MAYTAQVTEQRFHVTVNDDSGAVISFPNLTHEEYMDFQLSHMDDDLDFAINVGPAR